MLCGFVDYEPVICGAESNIDDDFGLGWLVCAFPSWLGIKVTSLKQLFAQNNKDNVVQIAICSLLSIVCSYQKGMFIGHLRKE